MKKFLLIALSTCTLLMAIDLPQSLESTIQSINKNGKTATISSNVSRGISGIVIHGYGNGLRAITHTVIGQNGSEVKIESYTALAHDNLPSIKSAVQKGDKVIFGNFYNNLMLIAPNEQSYNKITKNMDKNWVHPDLFAMYLISNKENEISFDNIKKFSLENQIGLVLIVGKDKLRVLDPISQSYLSEEHFSASSKKILSPFYARFGQISNNFFGSESKKEFPKYYEGVEAIK